MNQSSNAIAPVPHAIPPSPPPPPKPKGGPRGGIHDPFPIKFYRMLDQTRNEGSESIVSWLSHGRAFKIHKPKVFAATIMPRFFNQSKYTSFQRQLNLYGFTRCCRGRDSGAYHHPLFLRGRPNLLPKITRTKIKGNGHKTMKLHEMEPDFHAMAPLENAQETSSLGDAPSVVSLPRLEQPTVAASSAGCGVSKTSLPPPSLPTENLVNRPVSSLSVQASSPSDFVNDLNKSIFIHELAMGCSILCQLRRDTNKL